MADVLAIDASGLKVLRDLHHRAMVHRSALLLTELHAQPLVAAQRAGLFELIGEANIHASLEDAVTHAREILA